MWKDDKYIYTKGILTAIAYNYNHIYEGVEFRFGHAEYDPYKIVEFKVDFDMALDAIGRGEWTGKMEDKDFGDFRHFGRLQRLVIADIYNIPDWELLDFDLVHIPRLKGRAYSWMSHCLNGLPYGQQFMPKTIDKYDII